MSGFAKPRKSFTLSHQLTRHDTEIRTLFGLNRIVMTPQSIQTPIGGSAAAAPNNGTDEGFLKTKGDTMMGPIAFSQRAALIILPSTTLDISSTTTAYSSFVTIAPNSGTTVTINTISGAAFNGQVLHLQAAPTITVTLGTSGNISTMTGSNMSYSNKNVVILIFDAGTNKWQMVTSGSNSSSSVLWSAVTIDTDKDMQGYNLHGLAKIEFQVSSGTPSEIDGNDNAINMKIKGSDFCIISRGTAAGFQGTGVLEVQGGPQVGYLATNPVASIKLVSNDATPTVSQIVGLVSFDASNNIGVRKSFTWIRAMLDNVVSGSESGRMQIYTRNGVSELRGLVIDNNGTFVDNGSFTVANSAIFQGNVQLGTTPSDILLGYGAFRGFRTVVTNVSSGSLSVTDQHVVLVSTNTSGTVTFNLPSAATHAGNHYYFYKRNAGGSMTIARSGADSIDGAVSVSFSTQYDALHIISDGGTRWMIISTT